MELVLAFERKIKKNFSTCFFITLLPHICNYIQNYREKYTISKNIIKKLTMNNENDYVIIFEIIELKNNKSIIYFNDEIKKFINNAKINITSVNNDIENI